MSTGVDDLDEWLAASGERRHRGEDEQTTRAALRAGVARERPSHYPPEVVDARDAAFHVSQAFGRACTDSTIRHWVRTDGLRQVGMDGKRALYNLHDVERIAAGKRAYRQAA